MFCFTLICENLLPRIFQRILFPTNVLIVNLPQLTGALNKAW